MNFNQIVNNYLSELRLEVGAGQSSGEATSELSYRTSLDNFFKNVAAFINPKIVTIPEPKNQNKLGRPDWRFHNSDSMGVYGYVEAKGLDVKNPIDAFSYKDQVNKYLILGNPVLLTDGIDFIMFSPNGDIKNYSLCQKPINWEAINANLELETLFLTFFGQVGYRTISENQLVLEVAKRAKLLKGDIKEFLELDDDEAEDESELRTLLLLKELQETARLSHDKSLKGNDAFASFISQILAFGLLYAHRVVANSCNVPAEKYIRIHEFWFTYLYDEYTSKLIPFRTLVKGLETELNSDLSRLGLWYDDLRRLLSHIHLSNEQVDMPDFHELYESFLAVYDPETRFDYGAFYTPRYLAFYMIELAKSIIRHSISDIDFQTTIHKIIDPCCGTGTFIEAVIKNLSPLNESKIIGFEILPVPYALAHYRMTMLNDDYPENVRIILTNALSDNLFIHNNDWSEDETLGNLLLKEQQAAYNLAITPITLIIGNPPSSDSKFQIDNEGNTIKQLIDDFRPPLVDRTGRQNTQKQLSNEFIKFLRWTVERALKSLPSIFVLILPSSFAKHPSYKYARKYLIEKFDELWVLDFDSDNRTGAGDSNVFQTLQGRLILAGVFTSSSPNPISIKYKSINNLTRNEKINFFKDSSIDLTQWLSLEIDYENFTLKPVIDYNNELYSKFWPLSNDAETGIFYRHCSSLKLAPTHLLVHASSGQLKRRSKFIARPENNFETINDRWYSGQRKPPPASKITTSIKLKLEQAINTNSITDYSYRPFIEASVLLNDDLLSELQKLGGGGTRDRPEIRSAYMHSQVLGFAVSPAPEDIGSSLHKFSSFCWHIPDNDLSARGNAHIFCNYFPEYKKKRVWDPTIKTNVNQGLILKMVSDFEMDVTDLIDEITFYSYAILSSEFYLQTFQGILFSVAGEWPRIPITKDKPTFHAIARLGQKLAHLESKNEKDSEMSSDETIITYYNYKIEKNCVKLVNLSGGIEKVYNDIPDEVLTFNVSGYNVVKEWLKLYSFPYYRKGLSMKELVEFETLITKIKYYQEIIVELDVLVEEVIDGDLFSLY